MMTILHDILKTLHVLGAILFLGNIIVTAVWKTLADRTGQPAVIGYSQRLVTVTDIAFTLTGALLLAVTGSIMAVHMSLFQSGWLVWGIALFALTAVIWIAVLIPIQVRQARLARQFATADAIPPQYWRLARIWTIGGAIAVLLPLVVVVLMVIKPA